jgi:hypothetical protein
MMADPAASKFVFDGLGLIPSTRDAKGVEAQWAFWVVQGR